MQGQVSQLTSQVASEQRKNEQLTRQLESMSAELEELRKWVKTAKMKAATLNLGMFAGKEAKDLRDYISQAPQR